MKTHNQQGRLGASPIKSDLDLSKVILACRRTFAHALVLVSLVALVGCAGFVRAPLGRDAGPGYDSSQVHLVDLTPETLRHLAEADTAVIPNELMTGNRQSYKIGPFDVVVVTVWEHPELTTPLGQFRTDLAAGQLVDADGTLYFPYAGRVKVSGLTVSEVQKLMTTALAKVLRDPQIDIKLVGYRSQRVYLSGAVTSPGIYPVDDVPLSLPELLHRAGGINPVGDGSNVELARGGRTHVLNVTAAQKYGRSLDSLILLPGDQIRVPNSSEQKAYLLGEVAKPSTVVLNNGRTSLVQALADAGGFNVLTADAGAVYILRAQNNKSMNVYRLNAGNTVALAWADQFQLHPRDLVFVDQSGTGQWNRIIQQMLPTAQLLNTLLSTTSTGVNTGIGVRNLQNGN